MSRIAVITYTGNSQTDSVLRGVMGHLVEDRGFVPIHEFKNIPAVTEIPSIALAGMPGSVVELEIDDANLMAFKALMASKLQERWVKMYDQVISRLPEGIAQVALASERDKVVDGCQAVMDAFPAEAPWVVVTRLFQNVSGEVRFADDEEFDDNPLQRSDEFHLNAASVLLNQNTPWIASATSGEQVLLYEENARIDTNEKSNATGVGVLQLAYHGTSEGLVNIMNQLPPELATIVYGPDKSEGGSRTVCCGFKEIAWHAPVQSNVDTNDVAVINTDAAAGGNGAAVLAQPVTRPIESVAVTEDPFKAAYERGRMVGRAEGYNSGYSAKASESDSDDDTDAGEAPTAG